MVTVQSTSSDYNARSARKAARGAVGEAPNVVNTTILPLITCHKCFLEHGVLGFFQGGSQ